MIQDWWTWNKDSIYLGCVIAVLSGPIFAVGHELTKSVIFYIKAKFGPK